MTCYFLPSFDQFLMIVLTGIIAYSAIKQARYVKEQARLAKEQARLFAESEARHRERDQPNVRISHASYGFGEGTAAGNRQSKTFVGLVYANASPFDITVTSVEFEVGVPADTPIEDSTAPVRSLPFKPVREYKGTKLSDSLPRRLRHGETITMLYAEDVLLEKLRKHGGGEPAAVLPVCHDSLGNKHRADAWTVWGKDSLGGRADPGPGYITWDEWSAKRQHAKRAKILGAEGGKAKRRWSFLGW